MPDADVAVEACGCDVLVAGVECCGNDAEFVSLGEGEGVGVLWVGVVGLWGDYRHGVFLMYFAPGDAEHCRMTVVVSHAHPLVITAERSTQRQCTVGIDNVHYFGAAHSI